MYINPRIIALYDEYTHAPRLETPETMEFGGMRCYVARPRDAAAKMPAVIVIHENRGLNPHIEDVTRRAARRGPRAP